MSDSNNFDYVDPADPTKGLMAPVSTFGGVEDVLSGQDNGLFFK